MLDSGAVLLRLACTPQADLGKLYSLRMFSADFEKWLNRQNN